MNLLHIIFTIKCIYKLIKFIYLIKHNIKIKLYDKRNTWILNKEYILLQYFIILIFNHLLIL